MKNNIQSNILPLEVKNNNENNIT